MMMMIDLMMVVAAAVVGTVMVRVWAMEEAVVAGAASTAGAGPTGQQPTTVAACTGPRQGFGWAGFR